STEPKTATNVINGRINGRFAPGVSGNPGGSPEATRRAFKKRFLLDLAEDWQQHGREVFKRVRRGRPARPFKVCAMLVPKEMKVEHSHGVKDLTAPLPGAGKLGMTAFASITFASSPACAASIASIHAIACSSCSWLRPIENGREAYHCDERALNSLPFLRGTSAGFLRTAWPSHASARPVQGLLERLTLGLGHLGAARCD